MAEALRDHRTGGSSRLVGLLTRYGGAIEADLQETYGLDLAVLWRARRWRRLLVLIEGLPRTSRYVEEVAQDDELEALLDPKRKVADRGPRLTEFGPQEEALANVQDLLAQLLAATISAAGGRAQHPKPVPRPNLARHRREEFDRLRQHRATTALFGFTS